MVRQIKCTCGCIEYLNEERRLHRIDGPAMDRNNCSHSYHDPNEWWINGQRLDVKTNEEFLQLMKLKAFW